jgi:hypothetical protein
MDMPFRPDWNFLRRPITPNRLMVVRALCASVYPLLVSEKIAVWVISTAWFRPSGCRYR